VTGANTTSGARSTVTVLIGCPGAGKSSWCRRQRGRLGAVVSFDTAREHLAGAAADQSVTAQAVALTHQRARGHLLAGKSVLVDATGAAILDRAGWLEVARQRTARPHAVVLRTPLALALRRNGVRERQVPEEVLVAMWHAIDRTTARELLAEGFHAVVELLPQMVVDQHERGRLAAAGSG
jgi:predicted kinase